MAADSSQLLEELAYCSATDLAGRIRRRDVSPTELVEASIARIERRNPSLNAFVFQGFDDARAAAREADQAVMSGQVLGPLHGVPTAIKDLFDFKPGWPATLGGVRALRDHVTAHSCVFAERVERAGAIILGKTNSPVMGFRGTCDNPLFGASRNPFDVTRNTGGSSGGSAAAVADGLVPFAEGTDGGGSIRIPAAWCGVYGYKASFGRVPCVVRPNAFSNTMPFLFEGPLTRTVEDAALVLSCISGHDSRDPFSIQGPHDFTTSLRTPVTGMRVAYSPDLGVYPVDPRIATAVADAVAGFQDAGARVDHIDIHLPHDQRELSDLWCRQIMLVNIATLESFKATGVDLLGDHSPDFPDQYVRWARETYGMSITELNRDYVMRTVVYDALEAVLADYDVLITPTLAAPPVRNHEQPGATVGPSSVNGVAVDELIGWCLTYPMNFSGHPAASVPAGLVEGLPVGLQIIGRRYDDTTVLAMSAAFERVRPWRDTYRVCADRPVDVQAADAVTDIEE